MCRTKGCGAVKEAQGGQRTGCNEGAATQQRAARTWRTLQQCMPGHQGVRGVGLPHVPSHATGVLTPSQLRNYPLSPIPLVPLNPQPTEAGLGYAAMQTWREDAVAGSDGQAWHDAHQCDLAECESHLSAKPLPHTCPSTLCSMAALHGCERGGHMGCLGGGAGEGLRTAQEIVRPNL
jgi:hypothetical protein